MTRIATITAFLLFSASAQASERWLMVTSACGEQGQKIRCNTFHAPSLFNSEEDCLLRVEDYEAANIKTGEAAKVVNVWAWSDCLYIPTKQKPGEAS